MKTVVPVEQFEALLRTAKGIDICVASLHVLVLPPFTCTKYSDAPSTELVLDCNNSNIRIGLVDREIIVVGKDDRSVSLLISPIVEGSETPATEYITIVIKI